MPIEMIIYIASGVIAFIAIALGINSIRRFTPDGYASIVTGFGEPKIYIRKAFLKIPIVHKVTNLVISKFSLDIRTDDRNKVKTKDMFDTQLDANANVYLALNLPKETFERMMLLSAPESAFDIEYDADGNELSRSYVKERDTTRLTDEDYNKLNDIIIDTYAGREEVEVTKFAIDILNATLREAVGSLDLLTIQGDKDAFGSRILELAIRDLLRIGFVIDNFNIQDFKDTEGTLDGMGENSKEVIMEQSVLLKNESKLRQDRNTSETQNKTDEAAKENEYKIAQRAANHETEVSKLENEKIAALAEQSAIAQEATAKSDIRIATAKSDSVVAQNKAKAEILESEAIVREKELTIEKEVEVTATANAEKKRVQIENETLLDAAKAKLEIAEVNVQIAEKEANAIRLKNQAEADGIEAKANAKGKLTEIEIKSQLVAILPQLVEAQAAIYKGIDGVTIIGGSDAVTDYGTNASNMAGTDAVMKQIFGFGLSELVGTNIQAKVNAKAIGEEFSTVKTPEEN